jgi:hypothetical protein
MCIADMVETIVNDWTEADWAEPNRRRSTELPPRRRSGNHYGDGHRQRIAIALPPVRWLARDVAPSDFRPCGGSSPPAHRFQISLRSRCTAMLAGFRTLMQTRHGPDR